MIILETIEFIILLLVFLIAIVFVSELITIKTYNEYVNNKTVFYCIERPELTCTIVSMNYTDVDNQRMEILVRYPSGNKIVVFTNVRTFEKIWTIYK